MDQNFQLSEKAIIHLGKLLDLHLFTFTNENLTEVCQIHGKLDELEQCKAYLVFNQYDNFNKLLFHTQGSLTDFVTKEMKYKEIRLDPLQKETKEIKENFPKLARQWALKENCGQRFISLDMRSANWTVLKEILGIEPEVTFADYVQTFCPEAGVPRCLLESKYFRQFVLGQLRKLKIIWELETCRLLQKILKKVQPNMIVLNSDEIVFEYNEEVLKICQELVNSKFRLRVVSLDAIVITAEPIENYPTFGFVVRWDEDQWKLMALAPCYYNMVLKELKT